MACAKLLACARKHAVIVRSVPATAKRRKRSQSRERLPCPPALRYIVVERMEDIPITAKIPSAINACQGKGASEAWLKIGHKNIQRKNSGPRISRRLLCLDLLNQERINICCKSVTQKADYARWTRHGGCIYALSCAVHSLRRS